MAARWRQGALKGLLALGALASLAAAEMKVKVIEAGRVYPYLERFLGLKPSAHDRFVLAYYATANGRPATNLRLTFLSNLSRWPIPVRSDGLIDRMPTLAELRANGRVMVEGPDHTTLAITQEVHPAQPPAREMDAGELRADLAQITAASRGMAGPFGFVVPKLERAEFHGVVSGEAVYADGHTAVLKLFNGNPYFDADMVGVKTLRFARAPERIELEPKE